MSHHKLIETAVAYIYYMRDLCALAEIVQACECYLVHSNWMIERLNHTADPRQNVRRSALRAPTPAIK